jgi:DNA gyrase subunit A
MEEDTLAPLAEPVEQPVSTDLVRSVENEMEERYLQYSMSVIVMRALPDVRDGLKPVHRRILHAMNVNNWRSGSKTIKSARITGDVAGKYHPHGTSAIYDSMVRMAQPWAMRYPLISSQGNFGSMDGHPPAAERYTEAKLHKHAEAMLDDIEKETVPLRDNYDGTHKEPEVLPAKLPNLLLNGQMGIAVGMATNIPPHNLSELVDATIHQIQNPDASVDDLIQFVQGPDFPTGGVVYGQDSIRRAFTTGRGGVVVRGVAQIEEDDKGKKQIIITEIPYAVNKATLIEKIAELHHDKKIVGISGLRDESSKGLVRIVIDLKKDAYPSKILNQLFKMTSLQTAFHYNMLALVDGIQPRVLGLQDILQEYIKHRQVVVRRRTEFELRKAQARAHILEGLKIALDHIDEVIATIRASSTADEARENLIKKFKLSELQAKAILEMQLRALAGLERQKIEDELAALKELITGLEAILADEQKVFGIIVDELSEMKRLYGDERRTQIIPQELGRMSDEDLIPNESVAILITKGNYIKRTPLDVYKRQARGGKGRRGMTTKEEDVIEHIVMANTHQYVLFFTTKGRVFRLKAYEIPEASLQARGQALVNFLQLHPDETVSSVINLDASVEGDGYLFMCTERGTIKKTDLKSYQNVRQSGLIALRLDEGDVLRWVRVTSGDNQILISTALGQTIRFAETDARPMGRTARGVRGIRLRSQDQVVAMDVVQEDTLVFVISENGYGKQTRAGQITPHKRGGVGVRIAIVNDKTGRVVAVKAIAAKQEGEIRASEILIISTQGQTIRLGLDTIPSIGRSTQGVRIMKLNDKDRVASVAFVHESDEAEPEEPSEAESAPEKAA